MFAKNPKNRQDRFSKKLISEAHLVQVMISPLIYTLFLIDPNLDVFIGEQKLESSSLMRDVLKKTDFHVTKPGFGDIFAVENKKK